MREEATEGFLLCGAARIIEAFLLCGARAERLGPLYASVGAFGLGARDGNGLT